MWGQPVVTLSTHMDTVPPFFPSREDAEFIWGRGACDAKGIIAAQVAAAEALRAAGFRIGLLFVSGEERDSAGAKAANLNPKGSRFLINGEPTDNRVAIASKGALRAVLKSTGKMAHSAYPELGESAIHKLIEALSNVLALPLPSVEDVGPSTVNIGQIQGATRPTSSPTKPRRRCWSVSSATQQRCALRWWKPQPAWPKWISRWRFRLSACAPWKGCPP
jgi:acetylornithine deacetylase